MFSDATSTKLRWMLIIGVGVPCLVAYVVSGIYRTNRDFETLEEFSQAWMESPEDWRFRTLSWLLGAEPRRHKDYPVSETKLSGMRTYHIQTLLGKSQMYRNSLTYDVGSIERDPIGFFVPGFAKRDKLVIEFDDNGVVSRISTSS